MYTFLIRSETYCIQTFCLSLLQQNNFFNNDGNCEVTFKGYNIKNGKIYFVYGLGPNLYRVKYKGVDIEFLSKRSSEVYSTFSQTDYHEDFYIIVHLSDYEKAFKIFQDFIADALDFSKKDNYIQIYNFNEKDSSWEQITRFFYRSLDSIYIPKEVKKDVVNSIKEFFESRDEYRKFGIPYKKVFMFCGPPGTGKTSFIFALASYFKKNLYTICLTENFRSFINSVQNTEDDCFIVIEDIDIALNKGRSTLKSEITNVLDGLCRKEGMIVFLTTNNEKEIEDVVKRPGRVDKIVRFNYPTKNEIFDMFINFLPSQKDLFEDFYEKIRKYKVSIPILQQILFKYRKCKNILNELKESDLDFEQENKNISYYL